MGGDVSDCKAGWYLKEVMNSAGATVQELYSSVFILTILIGISSFGSLTIMDGRRACDLSFGFTVTIISSTKPSTANTSC